MIVQRLERPLSLAVSLADAKAHARVDGDESDSEMQRMVATAVAEAEDLAQIALLSQAVRVTLDAWPRGNSFNLPIGPLLDWSSLDVTADGQPFEDFAIVTGLRPALRLNGARPFGLVVIEYTAGFGDAASDVPDDLQQAIMDQAAAYYDARGPGDPKMQARSPHFSRIIGRYRRVRL